MLDEDRVAVIRTKMSAELPHEMFRAHPQKATGELASVDAAHRTKTALRHFRNEDVSAGEILADLSAAMSLGLARHSAESVLKLFGRKFEPRDLLVVAHSFLRFSIAAVSPQVQAGPPGQANACIVHLK